MTSDGYMIEWRKQTKGVERFGELWRRNFGDQWLLLVDGVGYGCVSLPYGKEHYHGSVDPRPDIDVAGDEPYFVPVTVRRAATLAEAQEAHLAWVFDAVETGRLAVPAERRQQLDAGSEAFDQRLRAYKSQ